MFYKFHQNNSGGSWRGSFVDLYVEANSPSIANNIAESYGVYFNGCDSGIDCNCCGDRWDEADSYDATPEVTVNKVLITSETIPENYFKALKEVLSKEPNLFYSTYDAKIIFTNGSVLDIVYTQTIRDELRAVVEAAKDSYWGFYTYNHWKAPTPVSEYFESGYESGGYWDKSGNYGVKNLKSPGWLKYKASDYVVIGFFSKDKEEAVAKRKEYMRYLNAYNKAVKEFKKTFTESLLGSVDTDDEFEVIESLSVAINHSQ